MRYQLSFPGLDATALFYLTPELNKCFVSILQLSSPSNGAYTIEEEGYFSQDPGNPLYGDMHFYIYNKVSTLETLGIKSQSIFYIFVHN